MTCSSCFGCCFFSNDNEQLTVRTPLLEGHSAREDRRGHMSHQDIQTTATKVDQTTHLAHPQHSSSLISSHISTISSSISASQMIISFVAQAPANVKSSLSNPTHSNRISSLSSSQPIDNFAAAYAACRSGALHALQGWLQGNPHDLHEKDGKGQTLLHAAVEGAPKPDTVRWLLQQGISPNIENADGFTPLHLAAKYGHIESAKILVDNGAQVDLMNSNRDLPFDLAIRSGQEGIIHFFLGTTKRLQKENPPLSSDVDGYYLRQAKQQELVEEQIFYLQKISDDFIQKKSFVQGAKILNCAVALFYTLKENPLFEKYLFARLEKVKELFLETKGIKTPSATGERIMHYRRCLSTARDRCKIAQGQRQSVQKILADLTEEFKGILKGLILESQQLLGTPPTNWACIGMGSMSRSEMCPYSDVEFAFLVEEESLEAMEYFRTLSQLLELQVINLGETKLRVFGDREESPTLTGFSLDTGGNIPFGGVEELIASPKRLARFEASLWIDRNIILSNALSAVCYIAGEQQLFADYNQEKLLVLKQKDDSSLQENREKLVMHLLKGHLHEFYPDLSKRKEEAKEFTIKKELYRPFQEVLGCLALFYHLETKNTFDRIDELTKMDVFSQEGAKVLKQVVDQILLLRLEAHLFYKDEKESLYHIEEGESQNSRLLYLDKKWVDCVSEIYKVLLPFHKCADEFFRTKNKETLRNNLFYDDTPVSRGQALTKIGNSAQVQTAYQQAVSLDPENLAAVYGLAMAFALKGDNKEALKYLEKSLILATRFDNDSDIVSSIHNSFAVIYSRLGNYLKVLESYGKAVEILKRAYGENHASLALIYWSMGICCEKSGEPLDIHLALKCFQQVLKIQLHLYGEENLEVAEIYNKIAVTFDTMKMREEALEYTRKSLKIREHLCSSEDLQLAESYQNLYGALINLKRYEEALKECKKTLLMLCNIYQQEHPKITECLGHLISLLVFKETAKMMKEIIEEVYPRCVKILGSNNKLVRELFVLSIGAGVSFSTTKTQQTIIPTVTEVTRTNHPSSPQATGSDADALFRLGLRYKKGTGVTKDLQKAVDYFQKAADLGYVQAQMELGVCYFNGDGVERNPVLAEKYLRLAADQGDEYAEGVLNLLHATHGKAITAEDVLRLGGTRDPVKSARDFHYRADRGDAEAQMQFGLCCADGDGVEKNLFFATKYFRLAADQGHAQAQVRLGFCYTNSQGVEKDLILAAKYFHLAADQGNAQAQLALAMCYQYGDGVEKDLSLAVKYFQLAADQGDATAQCFLAMSYQYGDGVEDLSLAVKYFQLAADQGHATAQCFLGKSYQDGDGVEKDLFLAVKYYRLAVDQGHPLAQLSLAMCYKYGDGVEKDLSLAVKYFQLAADQGAATAQCFLAAFYENGLGVEKDLTLALKYYRLAADQGDAEAKEKLASFPKK